MSQGTQEKMHGSEAGPTQEVIKKKKKVHTLRESAVDAGLEAIKKLSEAPAPAVKMTARAAITMWLPAIVAEQARGTSLLRIYNDLRKATGLKISYRSFQNYVSGAARDAGLRPAKPKKEAVPPARPVPDAVPAPASVETPPAVEETASPAAAEWECPECLTGAKRQEFRKDPGKFYWKCPACEMVYNDNGGEISPQRLR